MMPHFANERARNFLKVTQPRVKSLDYKPGLSDASTSAHPTVAAF
jgi:hypothetical protein